MNSIMIIFSFILLPTVYYFLIKSFSKDYEKAISIYKETVSMQEGAIAKYKETVSIQVGTIEKYKTINLDLMKQLNIGKFLN